MLIKVIINEVKRKNGDVFSQYLCTNIHPKMLLFFLNKSTLGCSTPNHYGENCHLLCPDSCIKSHCHIETGYCFGCKDGYQGPKCEQRAYFW